MSPSGTPPPPWLFALFPLFFAALWLVIGTLLVRLSGWATLAGYFRADKAEAGASFKFASGSMGRSALPVRFNGVLFITVNERGMHLSLFAPFRFMSPALFIPWSKVASVEARQFLMARWSVITLRNQWPVLSIRGRAGDAILAAHARATAGNRNA